MFAHCALAMLIVTQVSPEATKKSVGRGMTLTNKDWWESDGSYFRLFSLRQGEHWSLGTAWMLTHDDGKEYSAFRGKYQIFSHKLDEGTLLLSLRFTRQYRARDSKGALKWQIDEEFAAEPRGVVIEIPLEDGSLPKDEIRLVVTEAFFLDEKGNRTAKRDGVGLLSLGHERQVDRTGFLEPNETTLFEDGDLRDDDLGEIVAARFLDDAPPGFKLRLLDADQVEFADRALERGDVHASVAYATRAIRADPRNAGAYAVRASAHRVELRPEDALGDINAAIRLEPGSLDHYQLRAEILVDLERYDEGIADYSRLIEKRFRVDEALEERARLYIHLARYDRAVRDFDELLKGKSRSNEHKISLAWILATCPDASVRDGRRAYDLAFDAARSTSYSDPFALDTLAAAYAELGAFGNAMDFAKKAADRSEGGTRQSCRAHFDSYAGRQPFRENAKQRNARILADDRDPR